MAEGTNQTENAGQAAEDPQKTLMFYADEASQQWIMIPGYKDYFDNEWTINEALHSTPNVDWSYEEKDIYFNFVDVLAEYIKNVYNRQLWYFEEYTAWVENAKTLNPKGNELYQKQFQYLQYLQKKEDKLNRKNNPKEQQQKQTKAAKVVEVVEKVEKVIVRASDPEINLQKLFSTVYDPAKYLSAEFLAKENANIVFIGHVDSGKSTLTGNIIKELKEIDEQELARNKIELKANKMEAWEDAAISDIIPEERVDGKTREYAKLNFSLEKKRFTLFDAPGHKNYVPNMIMGACQADIAILVISAKEGEFESGFEKEGQTKEHAMLAKALGVIELIVVVSKLGTVNWAQSRFDHIKTQVEPFLENNCGFHNVTFIPLDSIQNKNIHSKVDEAWYKGPHFLKYLNDIKLPERKPMGPLRIPVIDKFKDMGQLYVYGKVESGTIIEDQTVTILPQRMQMMIKEIFNAKDERMAFACAGDNIKMKVKGIEEGDISRGDMVCNNLNYCQESAELKANITILELPEEKKLLSSGYECVIHMHAIAAQVEVSMVKGKLDQETGKLMKATFLKAGEKGVCLINIERPICLEKHDFMPSLGRFTLRDQGKTIGYGEIVGLKPAKKLFDQQKQHLTGPTDKKVEQVTKGLGKMSVE